MEKELNFNSQALAITLVIYGLILALCYLTYLSIPYTQAQIELGGVEVNYGNTDKGMGDDFSSTESPSASLKVNNKTSAQTHSVPTQKLKLSNLGGSKDIFTQNNEEAEALKTSPKNRSTKTQFESPNPSQAPRPEKLNQNALYKGPSSAGTGGGDGNSNVAGNQGQLNGNVLSNNYSGGGGSGGGNSGGGVSLNLSGRKFISRPTLQDDGQTEGKITVTITVDREGSVVAADAGGRGTTIQNEELWRKCEEAVMRAKLNRITSGPEEQAGKVVFSFKLL